MVTYTEDILIYKKITKCISSCYTSAQLENANKLIILWRDMARGRVGKSKQSYGMSVLELMLRDAYLERRNQIDAVQDLSYIEMIGI
jgi:hypothetical protein